jgi:hypothetical protein
MIRTSDLVENDDQNLILNLLLIQKNVVPARSSLLWLGIAKVQFFCGVAWKCKSAVPCCTFFCIILSCNSSACCIRTMLRASRVEHNMSCTEEKCMNQGVFSCDSLPQG